MRLFPIMLGLALASVADASRIWQPMGNYVRRAELIAVADTHSGKTFNETVLTVREVLKGDVKLAGETLTIERHGFFSTGDARVPLDATNICVLLPAGWKEAKQWPVLEAYRTPEELAALRIVVKVCALENERERLLALRQTLGQSNRFLEQELFSQLRDMREAANFNVLTDLYSAPDLTNRVGLINLIGDIGDLRGVPTLIAAAESPDQKLSRTAVDHLRWKFPGAPGVTEAMRAAVQREHLTRVAAQYLARYDSDPKLTALAEGQGTAWLRAMRLIEAGKKDEGRAAVLRIVEDETENFRVRIIAASRLGYEATTREKNQLRRSLLPLLARQPYANDYLLALEVAEILRGLRHPDCLPALLPILQQTPFTYTKAAWTATMAIRELGDEARQKAITQIINELKSPPPKTALGANPLRYSLELIWLGRQQDFQEAERVMHFEYVPSWKSLSPLRALSDTKDEPGSLILLLAQRSALPAEAGEWLMLRQGELKDRQAIPELIATLANDPDWNKTQRASDALVAIGGNEVESELIKLFTHPDENRVRRHATDAAFKLLGDRSRDLAIRVLNEKDFGWKPAAYQTLGKLGTTNDLSLLYRLSDFWTGDRTNHYWAMSAVSEIRERCRYDVNGPIPPDRTPR